MTNFEDAKKAVESLYGEIQGYKAISFVYDAFIDGGNFETGDNYVFIGDLYSNANNGNTNIIYVLTFGGKQITIVNANGGNDSHSTHSAFIAKDANNKPAIDLSACQQPESVNIFGWLFQINK